MESFPTRLKKLRESRRIYQREIAEALGVTTRAYQFYESGRSEPNIKTLIAIADYYQGKLQCGCVLGATLMKPCA